MSNSNIFVALTSNEELWDKSKELILLGDWCLNDLSDKKKYKVLPHPIEFEDAHYLNFDKYNKQLYSKYLSFLTDILNDYHQTQYTEDYWNMVAGSFLFRYIGVMYEKYLTIKNLLKHYEKFECTTFDISENKTIVVDELHFMKLIQEENYNLEVYSKILSFYNINSKKIKNINLQNTANESNFKAYVKGPLELMFDLIGCLNNRSKTIFIKNSYLNINSIFKLAIYSKYKIKVKIKDRFSGQFSNKFNLKLRASIQESLPESSEFELLLKSLMPFDLPKSLIEDYNSLKNLAIQNYPTDAPEVIFSASSWYNDDLFKLWAAGLIGQSTMLGMQHGGTYGAIRYLIDEKYERKITDYYLTWGWSDSEDDSLIPFGSSKLLNYKESNLNSDDILFVMTTKPSFFCDLRFLPHETISYIADQEIFLENISVDLLSKFRIRPYPTENQKKYLNLWKKYNINIRVDSRRIKFLDSLTNCKLFVADHLMTTYIEALKMNIPTIIFLNKKYPNGLLSIGAIKIFQKLEDVGILHYSPKDAAFAINKIQNDINGWWFSSKVQRARKDFCDTFAKTPTSFIDDFDDLFDTILK
jgi:putative transferase (TIGR04331 family)